MLSPLPVKKEATWFRSFDLSLFIFFEISVLLQIQGTSCFPDPRVRTFNKEVKKEAIGLFQISEEFLLLLLHFLPTPPTVVFFGRI